MLHHAEYNMSQSPHGDIEVEQDERSPEDNELQNKDSMSRLEDVAEHGYDFEIKEQDRWLPIANGEWTFFIIYSTLLHPSRASPWLVSLSLCYARNPLPFRTIDLCARRLHLHLKWHRPIP